MQILIQYMKNTNVPLEEKIRFYESLKKAGIGVPKHHLNEVCQLVKNLLTNKARRLEGLMLLDLVLDKIPDQIFSEHLVFFLKQIIGMSANESHAETCFGLLNRLIVRSKSMLYMLRDIRHEVFPQLIQLVTRELAKVPASCALLSLTQAVVSLFAKSCGPNREPMERFLFKQIVQAELLNEATCDALAKTFATLSKCVADPETRHDVQTEYLNLMIRSCRLTEKLHSQTHERVSDESLAGTIYAITGESPLPSEGIDHLQAKLVIWRRLLFQLDVIGALLESTLTKTLSSESLFELLNTVLVSSGRDEHLSFLQPSLIFQSMSVLRQLIRRFGSQLLVKNTLMIPIFMHALDITLLNGAIDLSCMRTCIYETMTEWLSSIPPAAFYRAKPESLIKIVKLSCDDVTSFTGPKQAALVSSALALQRAIVLSYGHRDKDHVRSLLMQLIPYAIDLTSPFKGVFCTSSACRSRLYELLVAFCTNSNSTLLPPTAEIGKLVAEGMFDDDAQVRGICKAFNRIIDGIINPIECGFSKSYSHALHEHNREAKRLHLTRAERTRPVETQTIDGSLRAPRTCEKSTNTEIPPSLGMSVRQAQVDAAIRAISRPGPRSQKRKLDEVLGDRHILVPSDEDDEDAAMLDEEAESVGDDDDDEDDLEAEEDEEDDDGEAMEYDDEIPGKQAFPPAAKRRREHPLQTAQNGADAAVVIADDDDDDDVVVTHRDQGPCSSREPDGDVREAEDDCDEEDERNELERTDVLEKAAIHPISSAVIEDVDDDEVVEDVDDDEENDIDDDGEDDDDDMCEITDGPAPARAQPKGVVSGPNGIDASGENQNSIKVLAELTPVEDSRENGEEPTKEIISPAKIDAEHFEASSAKIPADEVMLEAVVVPIGVDDNEVADDFKRSENIEPIDAAAGAAIEAVKSGESTGGPA